MKIYHLLMTAAPLAMAHPALAETDTRPVEVAAPADPQAPGAAKPASSDTVTTGVARGRDRLDSAVSTSSLKETEILKLAPRSIAELLRAVPGVRSEASTGEGYGNVTIRGLPITAAGSKFLQLQEDGLPILEFGDLAFAGSDTFLRADINLAQVDVIRGGSASTFASNSPGGIINFVSKTGEVEGGAVELTGGLDYDNYRIDMDYGAHISDTLRFHVGGFYRQGEGPRRTGYDANKGGQIKLNITKEFAGGYIRLNAKYLDDRTPLYDTTPMRVTGSDSDPSYSAVAGFDPTDDALLSRYLGTKVGLDGNNELSSTSLRNGDHAVVKAIGFETQFDVHDWTVSERFRYADINNHVIATLNAAFLPLGAVAGAFGGGPGATFRYATGPNAGQAITTAVNGNGLLAPTVLNETRSRLDNVTNDLRISRVWKLGDGELTTTAGVYNSRQTIDNDFLWATILLDVRGEGKAALVDVTNPAGVPVTQGGYFGYGSVFATGGGFYRRYELTYDVNAPFGSVNYRFGRLAIGASVRYDFGSAQGTIYGTELNPGPKLTTVDVNRNGVISAAETRVGFIPLDRPVPVDYHYGLLSYSTGINFRIAEPLAVFARYSRGGRANNYRILFTPLVSTTDGSLIDKKYGVDVVRQAEAGVKYRLSDLTLNLTAFWAEAEDTNIDTARNRALIDRIYSAKGLEFEGGYRHGPFGLTASVTYTDANTDKDAINPAAVGKVPRQQAKFIYQATPQITTGRFSVGAVFIGTTSSYTSQTNGLKIPGYVTTGAFAQVRPAERLLLSLNASNLFDVTALTSVDADTIPASGIVAVRPLNGRTVSATARFDF